MGGMPYITQNQPHRSQTILFPVLSRPVMCGARGREGNTALLGVVVTGLPPEPKAPLFPRACAAGCALWTCNRANFDAVTIGDFDWQPSTRSERVVTTGNIGCMIGVTCCL